MQYSEINSRRTHRSWRNFQPSTRERHDGLGSGPIAITILLRSAHRQRTAADIETAAYLDLHAPPARVHAVTYHHNQEGTNPTLAFFL